MLLLKGKFQSYTARSIMEAFSIGRMHDLRLYVLFNRISVISGRWMSDNKRLCAMEPRLRLERFPPQVELRPGTARSVGQRLI